MPKKDSKDHPKSASDKIAALEAEIEKIKAAVAGAIGLFIE